ncbi:SDR family oxidoreductase [Streptosporangium sp. NPDC002607]
MRSRTAPRRLRKTARISSAAAATAASPGGLDGSSSSAVIQTDAPGELSVRAHLDAWAVNVIGALTAAAHVAPVMARRGSGSFLITGGMPEPKPQYVSLSLGKAGVRTLVTLLDQTYGPSGVHVASVTVCGPVAPGTDFDPDDIAEHYWRLHTQPRHLWEHEALHTGLITQEGGRSRRSP